jgi:hypothetical protein
MHEDCDIMGFAGEAEGRFVDIDHDVFGTWPDHL